MNIRTYIAIDLKSFYASVECIERGLDPLTTNLVVADKDRTEKTICLAISPALKSYGLPGRPRLFEVIKIIKDANSIRKLKLIDNIFKDKSFDINELNKNPNLEIDYIVAKPRMAYYMAYSNKIYNIYLKYISSEDIHIYSIDEVIIDITDYLNTYKMTARELASTIVKDIFDNTGITATVGIGTNMYLCKVAMDIVAKHVDADENGLRIAELDEMSYRKKLWSHKPITDFWRVGRGYAKKLEEYGIYTMGDVAMCSLGKDNDFYNEKLLYKLFGVNAELLIDHAWGYEPCLIKECKNYKPRTNGMSLGQVLQEPYDYEKAKLVLKEMANQVALNLVEKERLTNKIVLDICYDAENTDNSELKKIYKGDIKIDAYGRKIPKPAHGTINIGASTSSARIIVEYVIKLYNRIINKDLSIRKINISANMITQENSNEKNKYNQLSLFDNNKDDNSVYEKFILNKEKDMQQAMLNIKKKFGKNAILKGMSLIDGATAKERNEQIGGHRA